MRGFEWAGDNAGVPTQGGWGRVARRRVMGDGVPSIVRNVLKVNRKLDSHQNWEQELRARAPIRYRTCTAWSGCGCSTPAEAHAHRRRCDHTLRRAAHRRRKRPSRRDAAACLSTLAGSVPKPPPTRPQGKCRGGAAATMEQKDEGHPPLRPMAHLSTASWAVFCPITLGGGDI